MLASSIHASLSPPPSYEALVLDPRGPRSNTNLFVRKLASAVKETDLHNLFAPYGIITSSALMRDIHTGESLGIAFIRFGTHEEALGAMSALDGAELYGRPISIQWAKKQHDGTPIGEARRRIHKLFVRNIPTDVKVHQLRQLFAPYGTISNVTVHPDTAPLPSHSGKPQPERNIAFILFNDNGAAEQAVRVLHNSCPFPSCEGIPLLVKLAEDNRRRLERKQKYVDSAAETINTAVVFSLQGSSPAQSFLSGPSASVNFCPSNPGMTAQSPYSPTLSCSRGPSNQSAAHRNGAYVFTVSPDFVSLPSTQPTPSYMSPCGAAQIPFVASHSYTTATPSAAANPMYPHCHSATMTPYFGHIDHAIRTSKNYAQNSFQFPFSYDSVNRQPHAAPACTLIQPSHASFNREVQMPVGTIHGQHRAATVPYMCSGDVKEVDLTHKTWNALLQQVGSAGDAGTPDSEWSLNPHSGEAALTETDDIFELTQTLVSNLCDDN